MSRLLGPRRLWLAIAGLALLVAVGATGFAPPQVLDLIGHDQERWVERFAAAPEPVTVEVVDGTGSLPYVLPGPADAWAGGKTHRVLVRFAGPAGDHELRLRVADSHAEQPPVLTVSMNGREVGRLPVRRGARLDPRDTEPIRGSSYQLSIPAGVLDPGGAQTLVIENGHGAWVWLSGLQLFRSASTFAPRHYGLPGPPPRMALFALAIGLLALGAATPARAGRRLASLTRLGAGLGCLALLALAPWPPTGLDRSLLEWKVLLSAPRLVWLCLAGAVLAAQAPALPRRASSPLLHGTVFVSGALVMVLELAGFRLLSPFFGYSVYVWGALLGVVMAALAAGYALGGRLADLRPAPTLLYQALASAALVVLATLYAYPALIRLTVRLPLVAGTLLAALGLCFLPMVGLSLVPPFVIRLAAAGGDVGVTAGRVYALGTVGSLVGTLASAFVLVTGLGAALAWTVAGLVLLLVAAGGLVHAGATRSLGLALGLGLLAALPLPLRPELSVADLKGGTRIYATESEYSHLEVIEVGKTLRLVPQLRFTHTIYDPDRIFGHEVTYGLLPAFLTQPRAVLDLGLGGGTLARLYLHVFPDVRVDGVDIDPEMVRLGKRFLGLREDSRLRIAVADARAYLRAAPPARYDVVVWDLFQGGVFIPYYALTREAFEQGRARLTAGGVMAVFVARPRPFDAPGRPQRYARLFTAVGNTLRAVFPAVFFYPVAEIGYYFLALPEPMTLEAVRARLAGAAVPEAEWAIRIAMDAVAAFQPDPAVPILTDDWAPVDQLIYDAFFRE